MPSRTHKATLAANTVVTVTLDEAYESVKVIQLTTAPVAGTNEIWFTVDGSTPTVAGDNSILLPATYGATITAPAPTENLASESTSGNGTVVKLISAGASIVEVEGGL